MKRKGEITVFFSLTMLCVFGLLCVMAESARTAGARLYLQTAANSSLDSLFGEYHRELWEQFHIFGLEDGEDKELSERLKWYLTPYLEADHWYPIDLLEIQTDPVFQVTDQKGGILEQQILEYMKYGIWTSLDLSPERGEEIFKQMREGHAVWDQMEEYNGQSQEAWKLEECLNRIYQSLRLQEEYANSVEEAISEESFSQLFDLLRKTEQEVKKIPGLVRTYEKQADRLAAGLPQMEDSMSSNGEQMGERMGAILSGELEHYRSYIETDGARRQEIQKLVPISRENLAVIENTRQTAREVEDALDSWESSEEEMTEDADWSPVWASWRAFWTSSVQSFGKGQEEKRGWLKRIEDLVNGNLLELVLPSGQKVSNILLDQTDLPSVSAGTGQTDENNLVTRVLTGEYCAMHFRHYESETETGEKEWPDGIQYEMEYLLGGQGSDRENLASAVRQILVLREGFNLISLLADSSKREEARTLALVITGALGLTPFVEITALFIMTIWALAESVADVRILLAGGKVPLAKSREDWQLSLDQVLEFGRDQNIPGAEERGQGFSYEGYLKLLLLLQSSEQKYYRMMDLMQMRLRLRQEDFRMENCIWQAEVSLKGIGKHVFFALPFVETLTKSREHGYGLQVKTEKAY